MPYAENTTKRHGDYIHTVSGARFYPFDPRAEDVTIEDIAHVLSQLCRFGGHCSTFYSVAQHSVFVSLLVGRRAGEYIPRTPLPWAKMALIGLLHDASEAYLVDLPRPIKNMLPEYKIAEGMVEAAIWAHFGIDSADAIEYAPAIKTADRIALVTEARDLMPPVVMREWDEFRRQEPEPSKIVPLQPRQAARAFRRRFDGLVAAMARQEA